MEHTKNSIQEVFASKLIGAKGHEKNAYALGLKLANNLPDNLVLDIRGTKQGALNIGDLGEAFIKCLVEGKTFASASSKGRKDLDKRYYHEVKTFASANRNPNGMKKPVSFIAISKYGVYQINRDSITNRWDLLKDNKGLKEISLSILKEIIDNDNPKQLHNLTEQMLG